MFISSYSFVIQPYFMSGTHTSILVLPLGQHYGAMQGRFLESWGRNPSECPGGHPNLGGEGKQGGTWKKQGFGGYSLDWNTINLWFLSYSKFLAFLLPPWLLFLGPPYKCLSSSSQLGMLPPTAVLPALPPIAPRWGSLSLPGRSETSSMAIHCSHVSRPPRTHPFLSTCTSACF